MAPPPPLGAEIFSQGFRFLPTPEQAVMYYLPRLIAGTPLHDAVRPVVHHADVYARAPGDLARRFRPLPRTGDRFFFTPGVAGGRKRARGASAGRDGSWHAQTTTDIVVKPRGGDGRDAKTKVGELRKLRYKKSGGAYTDWLMEEYSSCSCYSAAAAGGGESSHFVLCKMYVSPRADPTSEAHKESAAYFFTLPPPATVVTRMQMQPVPAPAAAPKRPAAPPPMSPPCAKRMRRALVVQPAGGNVSSFMPQPPHSSCAPPPVVATRSPFAAVGKVLPLAPAHPIIRPAMRPHRSPTPLPAPQQQVQVPLPTAPEVVRVPLQQVPVRSKQRRVIDPSEAAAMLRDEAEDQTVAAPSHPPPPAATPALQDQDEDDWDDLEKALEF